MANCKEDMMGGSDKRPPLVVDRCVRLEAVADRGTFTLAVGPYALTRGGYALAPDWSVVIRKRNDLELEVMLQPPAAVPSEGAPHHPAAFINAIAEEGTKAEAVHWLQQIWNELCELRAMPVPAQVLSGCAVRAAIQQDRIDTYSRLNQDAHPGSDILYHLPEILWAEAQRFGNRYDALAGDWPAQDNIRFGEHLLAALANALSAARQRALDSRPTRDVTKLSEAPIG